AREDDYELIQVLLTDILKTIESSKILEIWCLTFSCSTKFQFVILISDGSHRYTCNMLVTHSYPCRHFYKDFLMQYNPISLCVESSSNDYAVANTFNLEHIKQLRGGELYTPQFFTSKQLSLNEDNQSENAPITNPIIFARRERPPGRAKSDIEIQDLNTKKCHRLSNTDTNIQLDNRKRYKRCSEKSHNRAICKAEI
ncbi:11619_t:CDS:2, partial [Dentiscutata erythropus]